MKHALLKLDFHGKAENPRYAEEMLHETA